MQLDYRLDLLLLADILHIAKNNSLRNMIRSQYLKYIGHVCRCPNTTLTKKMLFAKSRRPYKRRPWINYRMSPLSRQRVLHKIRVVSLHWSTVQSPVQLRGNRFTVWRSLTVLYCTVLYCTGTVEQGNNSSGIFLFQLSEN